MNCGPYELVAEIGRGASGSVWRARAPDGREVALKIVRASPATIDRFRREVRLLAGLDEAAGFVPLLDAGEAGDAAWLAMPLVAGGTLRDRLRNGPFSQENALALAKALAAAIARAHAAGVVHRDLKPENVLFTGRDAEGEALGGGARSPPSFAGGGWGRPLVTDLGLAKHFRGDTPGASVSVALSSTGELKGTVGYAPREQLADAKSAGPEADVFAIGAIVFECLTGEPAFGGDSPFDVIAKVDAGRFDARALARSAPRSLARVIERALACDASARFKDAGELRRALEAAGGARSRRGLVAVAALGVALVAAALVAIALPSREPRLPEIAPTAPPLASETPTARPSPSPSAIPDLCRGFLSTKLTRLVSCFGAYEWKTAVPILSIAVSQDGRRVLTGQGYRRDNGLLLWDGVMDTSVKLWDAQTGRELATLGGHARSVTSVAFLPGDRAISASGDGTLRITSLAGGTLLRAIDARCGAIYAAAVSPDGKRVAAAGEDGTIRIFATDDGRDLFTIPSHSKMATAVAWSSDSSRLASGCVDGAVRLWDVSILVSSAHAASEIKPEGMLAQKSAVTSLAWSRDRERILAGCQDSSVRLYDLDDSRTIDLGKHEAPVRAVAFVAGGERAVSVGLDARLVVWDLASASAIHRVAGAMNGLECVAIAPGHRAFSGGVENAIRAFDLDAGRELPHERFEQAVRVAISRDGRRMLSGGDDAVVRVRDADSGREISALRGHAGALHTLAFSPDGARAASGSTDATIRIWDLASAACTAVLPHDRSAVHRVLFTPDGRLLSCGDNAHLKLWDLLTSSAVELAGHTQGVFQLALFPDGKRLLSTGADETARVWDWEERRPLATIPVRASSVVGACDVSPDAARAIVGTWTGSVKLLDLGAEHEERALVASGAPVWAVAFLDDGRAVSACYDGTMTFWDPDSGAALDRVSLATSSDWIATLIARGRSLFAGTARGAILRFEVAPREK